MFIPFKKAFTCYAFFLGASVLCAQEISEKGVPWIDSYTSGQYNKHGKIWDIASANNGIVYMAGDAGLLEYDGRTWNQFKGSTGYTRSLLVLNDSLFYSGSDLDFGVWERDPYQQFVYTSLYPFSKDPNEENEEFWDVHRLDDKVIFVSFNNIYLYKNKQLTKIAAPHRFTGSFQGNGKIYLADEKNGLFVFNGMSLKPLFAYPQDKPFQVSGVYENADGLLVVTQKNGLFAYQTGGLKPVQNEVSGYLQKDQVFCTTAVGEGYYAFGTILNGLYITDRNGKIIQHINKQKGLPNNTVLSMHYSSNGYLWLGMDYGIAAVHLHDSLSYFFDYKGEFGTAYTALLKDGVFYLGTNQGLYKAEWRYLDNDVNIKPFTLVQGSEGQVWALDNIGDAVFCGHDKGLFIVSGNKLQQIHNEPGVWTMVPYKDNYLLTGNYNGISVFNKQGNTCTFLKKIDLILGSCNQLIVEKDSIFWVNIPNYGLIRFALNKDFSPENRMIFPSNMFLGNAPYLQKDEKGISLITDKQCYVFIQKENKFVAQEIAGLPNNVMGILDGVYKPIQINEQYQFYPIYNGFALSNTSITSGLKNSDYLLLVRKVEAFNNNVRQRISTDSIIPYSRNNLRFDYIVPQQKDVLYQYRLDNYSKDWSPWSADASLDFLNLREGNYTLELRAKVHGTITNTTKVAFTISPPWYRTWYAYAGYLLLTVLLFYLIWQWQNSRLRRQKKLLLKKEQDSLRRLTEKYEQEALLSKQQQLEFEKNVLKQKVKQKNIELAKQAKDNKSKNHLLHILKEKMDKVQDDPALGKTYWAEMRRLLDLYLESDDKAFEIQIDELHQEFFQKLRAQFPDLSLYDLRLCAYLKIGLNSKEISEILNVLPSSINVSRSRLRKKLNLLHDEDLYGFLNQIH